MLAGIIAGALGGGAQAATDIADKEIAQRQKQDNMKLENQLMMEREEAIARRQQTIRREDSKWETVGEGADNRLKYETRKNEVENAGVIARERGLVDVRVDQSRRTKTAESEAEREGAAAYGRDKAAQAGDRAKAAARHFEGAEGVARAGEIQDRRKMLAEYENPKTSPERKAELEPLLRARGVAIGGKVNLSDAVSAAKSYETMAEQATDPKVAAQYRAKASAILDEVANTRTPGVKGAASDPLGIRSTGGSPAPQKSSKAPATPKGVASDEIAMAEKVQRMDQETFDAYQRWSEGQPTSPRERQLLQKAGIKP